MAARLPNLRVFGVLCLLLLGVVGVIAYPRLFARGEGAEAVLAPSPLAAVRRGGEPVQPLPTVESLHLDGAKVALGKRLFFDPRLSRDDTLSCASCHDLARGGVDQVPVSRGVGGALGSINAPTVLNAGFNFRQFWDGRAATLEEQAGGPVENPVEMGSSWAQVMGKLQADPELKGAFQQAFGGPPSPERVKQALAEYERSLVTPSRFDRWLGGDKGALSEDEAAGYRLFKHHGCIACHQGVNLGGGSYQRFGIMDDYFAHKKKLTKADYGRFNVTGKAEDRFVFKVPTLRNVALTPPYFHDASATTLEEAVAVMGRYQLGLDLPPHDVLLITAFLRSLSGEVPQ